MASLLADAPTDSIRQKINVEREEEVVQGPLSAADEALLNTDVVSEKVDLDLDAGQVCDVNFCSGKDLEILKIVHVDGEVPDLPWKSSGFVVLPVGLYKH